MPLVNGTAQDVTREFFAGLITLENLSVPVADGDRITCTAITEVNLQDLDDGAFSVDLAPGLYKLTASGRTRKFTVPEGAGPYNLADLLRAASETPLPWLKQADDLTALRAIRSSRNLRLCYVLDDSNGFEAFYKYSQIPVADNAPGSVPADDGIGGWLRTSIS